MVRANRRSFRVGGSAPYLGSALLTALLVAACSSDEQPEEAPIVVHPRTSKGPESRWTACIHEPGPLPDDVERAVEAAPSLADCSHDVPLPCGACGDEGKLCAAAVTRGCCDKPYVVNSAMSPLDYWVCRCEGGEYNCWLRLPGASACSDCDMQPAGTCSESNAECPEGCYGVEAAPFDPERGCVARMFETVDCSAIYQTTWDTGCVRRVSDGAIFVTDSFTRHLQSDEWQACSADEIASTQVVCD